MYCFARCMMHVPTWEGVCTPYDPSRPTAPGAPHPPRHRWRVWGVRGRCPQIGRGGGKRVRPRSGTLREGRPRSAHDGSKSAWCPSRAREAPWERRERLGSDGSDIAKKRYKLGHPGVHQTGCSPLPTRCAGAWGGASAADLEGECNQRTCRVKLVELCKL